MTTADSIHAMPLNEVLKLWAKGWSAAMIVASVVDERGHRFSADGVHKAVLAARQRGDPRAIFHRTGRRKQDWRG